MALYSGLDPAQALDKWHAIRSKPQDQLTPEELADVNGNMTGLAQENPDAWKMVRTGRNDTGQSKEIFNPQTGQWDTQKDQGFWSHPQSWFQLAAGGALAAPAVLGAIGAASTGAGAGSSIAGGTTVPLYGAAAGAGPATAGAGGSMGVLSSIGKMFAGKLHNLIGAGLAGAANSAAGNRGAALNAGLDADRIAIAREAENRAERADAMKRLQQTQYLQTRQPYQARPGLPTYGTTNGATTDVERQGAAGLEHELLTRLLGGSQLPATDVSKYTKPSVWEQIAGYGAPIFGAMNGVRK